jgi:hypothetical protein
MVDDEVTAGLADLVLDEYKCDLYSYCGDICESGFENIADLFATAEQQGRSANAVLVLRTKGGDAETTSIQRGNNQL